MLLMQAIECAHRVEQRSWQTEAPKENVSEVDDLSGQGLLISKKATVAWGSSSVSRAKTARPST